MHRENSPESGTLRSSLRAAALGLVALVLAACNAGSLLKTGSLTSGGTAPPPKAATPIDRALHVAATSARAQKCGFYFDPAALRTNFLTAEAARGTQPDILAKTGQSYDYTAKTIASKITDSEAYCIATRTASIKTSLQAALAGNFEPPQKKADPNSGGLAALFETDEPQKERFNRDHIYDPLLNDETKKAE